jgi:thioredoxin 1
VQKKLLIGVVGGLALVGVSVVGYRSIQPKAPVAAVEGSGHDMAMDKSGKSSDSSTAADSMKKDDHAMTDSSTTASGSQAGSYQAYDSSKLVNAKTGKVVIFFAASWCPDCRKLDGDITAHLGQIPATTTILKADYDKEVALKQKYGVTYQHTMVQVDQDGNLLKKWSGSPTLADLVSKSI